MAIKTESVIASIHPKQSKNMRLKFYRRCERKAGFEESLICPDLLSTIRLVLN